jgi:hypothetical protein
MFIIYNVIRQNFGDINSIKCHSMKQIAIFTLGFFLICEQSFAQITLNMSGYPTSFSGADSIKATIVIPGLHH